MLHVHKMINVPIHDTFSISTQNVIESVVSRLSSFMTIIMPERYQDKMTT